MDNNNFDPNMQPQMTPQEPQPVQPQQVQPQQVQPQPMQQMDYNNYQQPAQPMQQMDYNNYQQPVQPMQQMDYNNYQQPMQPQMNYNNYQQPMQPQYAKPANKKTLIIVGAVLAVIVIAIACIFIFGDKKGKSKKTECEFCGDVKVCKQYEMSAFGQKETGWVCDECKDEYEDWGIDFKLK